MINKLIATSFSLNGIHFLLTLYKHIKEVLMYFIKPATVCNNLKSPYFDLFFFPPESDYFSRQ